MLSNCHLICSAMNPGLIWVFILHKQIVVPLVQVLVQFSKNDKNLFESLCTVRGYLLVAVFFLV